MLPESKIFLSNTDEFGCYFALKRAIKSLGINLNFKKAIIKINLCSLRPRETGSTSDPIVVEQLVKLLNEFGIQVILVESSSYGRDADLLFSYLGFKSLEKKYDVKCVNLSRDDYSVKKIDGYYLKSIRVARTMESADFFITHPKLKTHTSLGVRLTGALKNQFGCLMDKKKVAYHPVIHEVIADVNQIFNPDLTVMDAIIAMTGYGPTTGIPQRMNLLLTSVDPVATDALGAKLFGYNPRTIKYLKLAERKRLGSTKFKAVGDKIQGCRCEMHINNLAIRSFELLSHIGINAPGD